MFEFYLLGLVMFIRVFMLVLLVYIWLLCLWMIL